MKTKFNRYDLTFVLKFGFPEKGPSTQCVSSIGRITALNVPAQPSRSEVFTVRGNAFILLGTDAKLIQKPRAVVLLLELD